MSVRIELSAGVALHTTTSAWPQPKLAGEGSRGSVETQPTASTKTLATNTRRRMYHTRSPLSGLSSVRVPLASWK